MRRLPTGLLAMALSAAPAMAQTPAPAAPAPGGEARPDAAEPAPQLSAKDQAAVYFEQGRAFFKAKDYRAAAEQFQAAYNLDPVPILLYNMARAAEEMGDPERSIAHYQSYLKRIGPKAEDRDEVQRRIRVMEKTIAAARRAKVRIVGLPPKATITVDGEPTALEDGLVRAEPGQRVVQVSPVDGPPWSKTLTLTTGQYVEVAFGESDAPPPPPPGVSGRAIAGWSAVGAGAVLGAVGAIFYSGASDSADDWQAAVDLLELTSDPDAQRSLIDRKNTAADEVDSKGTAAYVLWGLGGAALIGGAVLLALEYGDSGEPGVEASVVPLPGGVGLIGRF